MHIYTNNCISLCTHYNTFNKKFKDFLLKIVDFYSCSLFFIDFRAVEILIGFP